MKPEPLFHFGCIVLDPAVNRGVIDIHAAFLKHFFQLAIANPVTAIPANSPEDNFAAIMSPFEISAHCEYPHVLREHRANPDYLQQGHDFWEGKNLSELSYIEETSIGGPFWEK